MLEIENVMTEEYQISRYIWEEIVIIMTTFIQYFYVSEVVLKILPIISQ